MRNPKFGVVSLGCPKNTTDTEVMLGLLDQAGFVLVDNDEADICLVNTCSFIQDARNESVKTLVELAESGKELIIAGCLAQHFKEELLCELPEARAVVGTGDIHKIVEVARAIADDSALRIVQVSQTPNDHQDKVLPRIHTGFGTSAYLKIAEGCDHNCSFCIIPLLRGRFRSRSIESLVQEARILAASGVKEVILVSQDSTYYGLDLYGRMALAELLESLHEIDSLEWIRVMYFYPTEATDDLLTSIARLPKVVKYIDIPLQHSHPEILTAMARPHKPERAIERIRSLVPDVAIRSTFIVGFPGETTKHFEHLKAFVETHRFDRLGVFTYSRQTEVASGSMPGQVPENVKKSRRRQIMEVQHHISRERNQQLVGRQIKVMLESLDRRGGMYIGRSQWDAPEVDNQVLVKSGAADDSLLGELVDVVVEAAKSYDLVGRLVN